MTPSLCPRVSWLVPLFCGALAFAGCSRSSATAPKKPQLAHSSAALFGNGGFESGDLSQWTVQTFLNNTIIYPPASVADLQLQSGAGNVLTLAANGAANTQIPVGLTSNSTLRYSDFGNWSAVVNQGGNGQNVNLLTQTYQTSSADVDPTDSKIHVRFTIAPVLQNPGHPTEAQPYFWVDVVNATTGQMLFHSFNFSNQPGVPWLSDNFGTVLYTNWQLVDVAPGTTGLNIGDNVTVDVYASGCAYGGHFGEVYVDAFGSFIPGLLVVAHAPQSANAGDNITYNYLVTNGSGLNQTNATVTSVLPDGVTFVSLDAPAGASCTTPDVGSGGSVICNLGTVNASSSSSFSVVVAINNPATNNPISHGNYSVLADGSAALIGPLVETAVTSSIVYTDLAATMSNGSAAVSWGQPIQYSIVLANQGAQDVVGAGVSDVIPAQLTGATWTCTPDVGAACGASTGSGDIATTVDLPAGTTATFVLSATVVAGSGNGTLSNSLTITPPGGISDSDTSNNTATVVNSIGTVDTLTVQNVDGGPGTVISSPVGISCGPGCTSQSSGFADGSQVTLTAATAGSGVFMGFAGCTAAGNSCSFAIGGPTTVTATFGYSLTGSVTGGNGTMSCVSPVMAGAASTCTLVPDQGFVPATLTDNGTDVFALVVSNTYSLSNVSISHTLVATFSQAPGSPCTDASTCGSGFCVDGVCCNTSCSGQCEACDEDGSVGTCSPVSGAPRTEVTVRPSCTTNDVTCGGTCNGILTTACTYPTNTAQCSPPSCSNGVATLPATCDGAGSCQVAGTQACSQGLCQGTACKGNCTSDTNCSGSEWCAGGICVPRATSGGACTTGDQCQSNFCVDGVCCNTACSGQCQACNEEGLVGTCSPVAGAPQGSRPGCSTDGTSCGGTCDGVHLSACTYPSGSTQCRPASCGSGTDTLSATCNGEGSCGPLRTASCNAYVCGDTACKTTCTQDRDCTATDYCSSGICIPKAINGTTCSATNECGSGICVDGVCCDAACDGQCEACNVGGSVGTCVPAAGEPHGDRTQCPSDGTVCGSACDGTNRTACGFPGATVQCSAPSCSGGVEKLAATCDGAGGCPVAGTKSCGDTLCGATACQSGCQSDGDCVAADYCFEGQCQPRGNNGAWAARGAGGGCSSTGGSIGWLALLFVAFPLLRRSRKPQRVAARISLVLVGVMASAAQAQTQPGTSLSFTADRFQPEGGAYDLLGVQSARVAELREITGTAIVDYANEPLRLVSTQDPTKQVAILQHQTTLHLGASIGLWGNTELSVVLPVTLSQHSRDASMVAPDLGVPVASSALGDLRLAPKVRLLQRENFSLGISVPISLPTGHGQTYSGDGGVTAGARVLADFGSVGGLRLSSNVGVMFRPDRQYVQVHQTNSLQYGVALEVPLVSPETNVAGVFSMIGEKDFGYSGVAEEPLEVLGGVRWHGPLGIGLTLGGGPGITSGYGTPKYRLFAGLSWEGQAYHHVKPVSAPVVDQVPPAADCPLCPVCPVLSVSAPVTPAPEPVAAVAPAPEPAAPLAQVEGKRIALLKPITFVNGSAKVNEESLPVLNSAADTLKENPQIKVSIEGHTDSQGKPLQNLLLSKRRAAAVAQYLLDHGIAKDRMVTAGFGDTQPLASNSTDEGRAENRRVVFVIVEGARASF